MSPTLAARSLQAKNTWTTCFLATIRPCRWLARMIHCSTKSYKADKSTCKGSIVTFWVHQSCWPRQKAIKSHPTSCTTTTIIQGEQSMEPSSFHAMHPTCGAGHTSSPLPSYQLLQPRELISILTRIRKSESARSSSQFRKSAWWTLSSLGAVEREWRSLC